jgi:hypothetical protein
MAEEVVGGKIVNDGHSRSKLGLGGWRGWRCNLCGRHQDAVADAKGAWKRGAAEPEIILGRGGGSGRSEGRSGGGLGHDELAFAIEERDE